MLPQSTRSAPWSANGSLHPVVRPARGRAAAGAPGFARTGSAALRRWTLTRPAPAAAQTPPRRPCRTRITRVMRAFGALFPQHARSSARYTSRGTDPTHTALARRGESSPKAPFPCRGRKKVPYRVVLPRGKTSNFRLGTVPSWRRSLPPLFSPPSPLPPALTRFRRSTCSLTRSSSYPRTRFTLQHPPPSTLHPFNPLPCRPFHRSILFTPATPCTRSTATIASTSFPALLFSPVFLLHPFPRLPWSRSCPQTGIAVAAPRRTAAPATLSRVEPLTGRPAAPPPTLAGLR